MLVNCVSCITFGYSNILKTEWKAGRLPSVRYGLYGDRLTKKNVSLEHLKAKSKGGKSCLSNYALASKNNNSRRGNRDIKEYLTLDMIKRYFKQFVNTKTKGGFNGNEYIRIVTNTLRNLGFDL